MSNPKLIVIDDDAYHALFVCDIALIAGFESEKYTNARFFMEQYKPSMDVIVLDLFMPDVDGLEVIRFLSGMKCKAFLVLMSGVDAEVLHSVQHLAKELKLNVAGSLKKPFRSPQLVQLLRSLSLKSKKEIDLKKIVSPSLNELKRAFINNELIVHYQPKVGLDNNAYPAVEALVRWQHPSHGLLSPDVFVPMAEANNLINQLTWVVFGQVLAQCRRWKDQGLYVHVAINMSASTLKQRSLPGKIVQLLSNYGVEARQIVLEVTESALIQELFTSLEVLTRIRMQGIRLSIDDFGTGYSSLLQLHRVPFSEIKIDRAFVSEMETDAEAEAIVETIIMLGKKLKMNTVAEGVEAKSCQMKLKALGCNFAQGYLFSKPIPGEEIFAWFSDYRQ